MRTSKENSSTQALTQIEAYVRKLLGSSRPTSGWGATSSATISLPKGGSASSAVQKPQALPRQLQATAYTKSSQKTSSSGSSFGNAWLISPIASSISSILNLFGGGSSTSQSTRYRTTSRQPFRIVESISPETGSGTQNLNENAAALTGVTSPSTTGGGASSNTLNSTGINTTAPSSGTMSQLEDREALVTALRRSLGDSRGIADVLSEFQDGL